MAIWFQYSLARRLMDLARDEGDEVVKLYAIEMANDIDNWDKHMLDLVRAIAQNRRYLLERERKRVIETTPSISVVFQGGMDLALDALPIKELFHSLFRRLTRRLRNWYKGR